MNSISFKPPAIVTQDDEALLAQISWSKLNSPSLRSPRASATPKNTSKNGTGLRTPRSSTSFKPSSFIAKLARKVFPFRYILLLAGAIVNVALIIYLSNRKQSVAKVVDHVQIDINKTFAKRVPKSSAVNVDKNDIRNAKVMLCAILKNEESYIDEWLRYHQYMGFDFAYLYDNGDEPSSYLASLPQVYGDFVKVVRHEGKNQQRIVYDTCRQNFKDDNTWGAFMDVDEFIVLRKHASIQEFLQDVAPAGGAVVLNWSYFSNSGLRTQEPGPVVARFTYTTKELNPHLKTIAYLPHALAPDVHNTLLLPGHRTMDVQGRPHVDNSPFLHNVTGNREIAYINHYHSKSLEELLRKKRRGRADMDLGGPPVADADILESFRIEDKSLAEVQDTFARDFYMRHFFGASYDEMHSQGTHAAGKHIRRR